MDQFDELKKNFGNTDPVCRTDRWNECEFKCPAGQTWYNSTTNLQHNGIYFCDMYDSREWDSYQIDNVTFTCSVLDTACGNVAATYKLNEGVSSTCNDAGNCNLSCQNGLFALPHAQVSCNEQTMQWDKAAAPVSCADTYCGNSADFNFGSRWSRVKATCSYSAIDARSTCSLSCPNGGQPSHNEVICNAAKETVPAQGTEIFCPDGCNSKFSSFIISFQVARPDGNSMNQ